MRHPNPLDALGKCARRADETMAPRSGPCKAVGRAPSRLVCPLCVRRLRQQRSHRFPHFESRRRGSWRQRRDTRRIRGSGARRREWHGAGRLRRSSARRGERSRARWIRRGWHAERRRRWIAAKRRSRNRTRRHERRQRRNAGERWWAERGHRSERWHGRITTNDDVLVRVAHVRDGPAVLRSHVAARLGPARNAHVSAVSRQLRNGQLRLLLQAADDVAVRRHGRRLRVQQQQRPDQRSVRRRLAAH